MVGDKTTSWVPGGKTLSWVGGVLATAGVVYGIVRWFGFFKKKTQAAQPGQPAYVNGADHHHREHNLGGDEALTARR